VQRKKEERRRRRKRKDGGMIDYGLVMGGLGMSGQWVVDTVMVVMQQGG
jgi:hypothetical protein